MKLPPEIQERIAPKFDWIRLLDRAPHDSVFFTHDDRCAKWCERLDGKRGYTSRLRPSTIHHVAVSLALHANADGTEAWMGIDYLSREVKYHRGTVLNAVRHLEVKQLLYPMTRGGSKGIPRTWATVYALICPPAEVMAAAGLPAEMAAVYDWFARSPQPADG